MRRRFQSSLRPRPGDQKDLREPGGRQVLHHGEKVLAHQAPRAAE